MPRHVIPMGSLGDLRDLGLASGLLDTDIVKTPGSPPFRMILPDHGNNCPRPASADKIGLGPERRRAPM
jgi:hypothetical protein